MLKKETASKMIWKKNRVHKTVVILTPILFPWCEKDDSG